MNGTDLILILAAIFVSALCSGLEIAFVSSNKLYIELERKGGALWARIISGLLNRPGRLIGALLVGNNIALVVYGVLMAKWLEPWLFGLVASGFFVLVMQTLISTLVILVLAEFLPKTLFRIDPNGVLSFFAIPLQVLYVLLWIPTLFMTGIAEVLLRLMGVKTQPGQVVFGRIDLDDFLKEMGANQPRQSTMDAEVDYFRNTLELSNIKVRELMIPRAEMVAIDVEEPVSVLRDRLVETGLTKVLVYKDNIDDIIGYVHGYELFRHPKSIRSIIRPVNIIPGTMAADDLLQTFIKQRNHVAVVVDEFGGTAGMLTIEDVVETIVGDIEDEHDVPEDVEERLGEHEFLLSARSEVDHLRDTHALAIPESEEYDTLAGFILHSTGDLPDQGQIIELPPFRITVAQVEHSRIDLVRLEVLDPERGYLR